MVTKNRLKNIFSSNFDFKGNEFRSFLSTDCSKTMKSIYKWFTSNENHLFVQLILRKVQLNFALGPMFMILTNGSKILLFTFH